MTDRPIIFSAPMVQAILAGRKSMTRRLLKLAGRAPDYIGPRGCEDDPTCWGWEMPDGYFVTVEGDKKDHAPGWRNGWRDWAGAYAIGDRLWVKEAWFSTPAYNDLSPSQMGGDEPIKYQADGTEQVWGLPHLFIPGRYRPSIHMPRWASRLTLTVTDVRVQRLQDISEADARAEGVTRCGWAEAMAGDGRIEWHVPKGHDPGQFGMTNAYPFPQGAFAELWEKLHGPEAWGANPWVVALTFNVERRNIDAGGA